MLAGTVDSCPSIVIAAESPTRIRSTPAWSASLPPGASYAVTIAIGCRRALRCASSVMGSFPVPGRRVRVCADGCSRVDLLEWDVVDQAGRADADRAGEDGRVERGDLDVVDVEAVEQLQRARTVSGRQRAGERQREVTLFGASAAGSGRTGRARRRRERSGSARTSISRARSTTSRRITSTCCASLRPKKTHVRSDDREQLQAHRRDAAEVAGPMDALRGSSRRR